MQKAKTVLQYSFKWEQMCEKRRACMVFWGGHFLIRDYELFESDTRLIFLPKKYLLSKPSIQTSALLNPALEPLTCADVLHVLQ